MTKGSDWRSETLVPHPEAHLLLPLHGLLQALGVSLVSHHLRRQLPQQRSTLRPARLPACALRLQCLDLTLDRVQGKLLGGAVAAPLARLRPEPGSGRCEVRSRGAPGSLTSHFMRLVCAGRVCSGSRTCQRARLTGFVGLMCGCAWSGPEAAVRKWNHHAVSAVRSSQLCLSEWLGLGFG